VAADHTGRASLDDIQRHGILHALKAAGGRISGDGGAAAMLGLKPTTLHAKMKKLGVKRPGRRPA
jgi:formate hydrogenlyase transcriptional activator